MLTAISYQKKTFAITATITEQRIRAKTVSANSAIPVTTFAEDNWNIPKSIKPPIVEATNPEIKILRKLSDRLFNAPAI